MVAPSMGTCLFGGFAFLFGISAYTVIHLAGGDINNSVMFAPLCWMIVATVLLVLFTILGYRADIRLARGEFSEEEDDDWRH